MPGSGRVWRAKPNTEPHWLDIGGTCVYPPVNGGRDMRDAVEARVAGLRGPGAGMPMGERVGCAKPNIGRNALDICGTRV
jgi:hypothetical protein